MAIRTSGDCTIGFAAGTLECHHTSSSPRAAKSFCAAATRGSIAPTCRTWILRRRLEAAIAFRQALDIDATAWRLVHGEADLLPSLVVDRYGEYLVVQTLNQGMDAARAEIVSCLQEIFQPKGI